MKRDQNFFERYSLVIGALAIFAVAIFVLTMKMSNVTQDIGTGDNGDTVEQRIKPIGQVYLPGEELGASGPQVPPAEEAEPVTIALSGAQVFNQACNVCHGNGIGGAPMLNDIAAWESRIAQGNDILNEHAIDGYAGPVGFMPPKGGNASLSETEVRAAVSFMIAEVQKN